MLGYVILNDWAVMNWKICGRKKRAVSYLKVLSWNLFGLLRTSINNFIYDG
jgi:hypothetical protein